MSRATISVVSVSGWMLKTVARPKANAQQECQETDSQQLWDNPEIISPCLYMCACGLQLAIDEIRSRSQIRYIVARLPTYIAKVCTKLKGYACF